VLELDEWELEALAVSKTQRTIFVGHDHSGGAAVLRQLVASDLALE